MVLGADVPRLDLLGRRTRLMATPVSSVESLQSSLRSELAN